MQRSPVMKATIAGLVFYGDRLIRIYHHFECTTDRVPICGVVMFVIGKLENFPSVNLLLPVGTCDFSVDRFAIAIFISATSVSVSKPRMITKP